MKKIIPIIFFIILAVGGLIIFLLIRKDKNIFPEENSTQQRTGTANNEANIELSPTDMAVNGSSTGDISNQGLTIVINEPADKVTVSSEKLTIKGTVSTPSAEVFINDNEIKTDAAGNFFTEVSLDEGENEIIIIANDEQGNYAEKTLTVNLQAKQ